MEGLLTFEVYSPEGNNYNLLIEGVERVDFIKETGHTIMFGPNDGPKAIIPPTSTIVKIDKE